MKNNEIKSKEDVFHEKFLMLPQEQILYEFHPDFTFLLIMPLSYIFEQIFFHEKNYLYTGGYDYFEQLRQLARNRK
ncbi:MAG: hypothetical protein ACJAXY_001523 [Nonlabens sp.]